MMTVSLRASEVTKAEVERIVANVKTTHRYEGRHIIAVLTDPVLVYGKRWEFDIDVEEDRHL